MTTTTTYRVTGMTCAHCVSAVIAEVQTLPGVAGVDIELAAGGLSTVRVTSAEPLEAAQIAAALDEAGDYHLAAPEAGSA